MSDKAAIKKLIGDNQIPEAFAALKRALPDNNDLVNLESQWNTLRREKMMHTISYTDSSVRTAQIVAALLEFSNQVEDNRSNPVPFTPPAAQQQTSNSYAKKIFFSYSKHDRAYLDQLLKHLTTLRRRGKIAPWNDRDIMPGEEWDGVIKKQLVEADIILLLVSSDFLATDYIWDVELGMAMKRHEEKSAQVVPIAIRPCSWNETPFSKLNGLPSKIKPVSAYTSQDEAWLEVVQGIERLL